MTLRWMLRAVVTGAAALALGAPGSALALPANTWAPAAPLAAGTTSVGNQILSSPTGALLRYSVTNNRPALETVGPDGLGPATPIPSAPSGAVPGPVAFLPDGSAVVSYYEFNTGPLRLVVRAPNGSFGPVYKASSGAQSFAARAGEVLLLGSAFFNVKQVTALSLSIGSDGTLTPTAGPAVIYAAPGSPPDTFGTQIAVPVASVDADGQATALVHVDHVSTSGNEILEIRRTAGGAWGAPASLTAGLPGAAFTSEPKAAVAPGGRTLIAFQTGDGSLTKSTLWKSLREPGTAFPAPTVANDLQGAGGALNTVLAAAGGDGTLAFAVHASTCQSTSVAEVKLLTLTAFVAAPGAPLAAYGVGVRDTAGGSSRLVSLGAGAGQAIVGVNDEEVTAGNPPNVCGSVVTNTNGGTIFDRVSIVGPGGTGDHVFGSGQYLSGNSGSVVLKADAAGIGPTGDAAVTGRLVTSGVPASAFYQGSGTRPAAGGPSGGSATPGPPPPPAPANTSSASPRVGPLTLSGRGVVSVALTAPTFPDPRDVLGVQIALQVFAGARPSAARARSGPVGVVRKRVTLRSGQKLVVRLTLPPKLRSYLRLHPKALVRLQLTSTQSGRRPTVRTTTVRLKRKG